MTDTDVRNFASRQFVEYLGLHVRPSSAATGPGPANAASSSSSSTGPGAGGTGSPRGGGAEETNPTATSSSATAASQGSPATPSSSVAGVAAVGSSTSIASSLPWFSGFTAAATAAFDGESIFKADLAVETYPQNTVILAADARATGLYFVVEVRAVPLRPVPAATARG